MRGGLDTGARNKKGQEIEIIVKDTNTKSLKNNVKFLFRVRKKSDEPTKSGI